jgi:mannose-6-phosphate isomerase-like protein (cupin superfamily)
MDNSPKFDPWGNYTVLDEGENFKVKRIEVLPEKRLSYQSHRRRAEHWFVVGGTAKVTLNDRGNHSQNRRSRLTSRSATRTASKTRTPKETLVFIETQTGDYFGEDDIERYEDDFGME